MCHSLMITQNVLTALDPDSTPPQTRAMILKDDDEKEVVTQL